MWANPYQMVNAVHHHCNSQSGDRLDALLARAKHKKQQSVYYYAKVGFVLIDWLHIHELLFDCLMGIEHELVINPSPVTYACPIVIIDYFQSRNDYIIILHLCR